MIHERGTTLTTKTKTAERTPTEAAQERKLDDLINDGAYAKPYTPSEMPGEESAFANPAVRSAIDELGEAVEGEEQARGIVWNEETKHYEPRPPGAKFDRFGHALSDMAQQAELPPTTVYGINEELGEQDYDVAPDGTTQNFRPRQQPPPAKGDEPDLGPLTKEHFFEKAEIAMDKRILYLRSKAETTAFKKAFDDAAKERDQLHQQIREFGGFSKPKTEKAPTLFDKKPLVSDEEYEKFMGEPRPSEPESGGE